MAKVPVKKFLECVQRSTLVKEHDLRQALVDLKDEGGGALPDDAQVIADFLVKSELITKWHSSKLVEGKYKGFTLGKYKLLSLLGTGGMSSVYLAEHTLMRQKRAIKVLPKSRIHDSSYLERFYVEARASASLDHRNIVRAYDVDSEGDTHYLVMEYVEGKDLQNIVGEEGGLDYELAANYLAQAAVGLEHAHEIGLIHRDIKPANLLVDSKNTVKLLDLGLALFSNDEAASLTMAHNENVLGTADYLSPEQALNSHDVDKRVDIYSLGCTFYFMLTGHAPFPEGTLAQRIAKHQTQKPPEIHKQRPDCPIELEEICFKMMEKKPEDRFQSSQNVADVLEAWLLARGHLSEHKKPDSSVKMAAAVTVYKESGGSEIREAEPIDEMPTITETPRPSGRRPPERRPAEAPPGEPSRDDTVSDQSRATVKGMGMDSGKRTLPRAKLLDEPKPKAASSSVDLGIEVFGGAIATSEEPRSLMDKRRKRSGGSVPTWVWIVLGVGGLVVVAILVIAMSLKGAEKPKKDDEEKEKAPDTAGLYDESIPVDFRFSANQRPHPPRSAASQWR